MKQITLQTPIKVWYRVLPGTTKVKWPIVDIKLNHQGIALPQPLLALVDSGANSSILHPLLAESIGFDLKKLGPPKRGGLSVSGEYESWESPKTVNLDIYGYSFSTKFTIINNPNLIWPCILGEDSIFEFARLDFQKFKGYFEIRFRMDIN